MRVRTSRASAGVTQPLTRPAQMFFSAPPLIAFPETNGVLEEGTEWSISQETNMVTERLPWVAFRKYGSQATHFCTVLAPAAAEARSINVSVQEQLQGGLYVTVTEGEAAVVVAVAGPDDTAVPGVRAKGAELLAGHDRSVRVYRVVP